jgi:hypothetical protein
MPALADTADMNAAVMTIFHAPLRGLAALARVIAASHKRNVECAVRGECATCGAKTEPGENECASCFDDRQY